jgi:hypothetical protein
MEDLKMAKRRVVKRKRRTVHRKNLRGLRKMAIGTCKIFKTAAGTLMRGCMTAKGFRIKGKARG